MKFLPILSFVLLFAFSGLSQTQGVAYTAVGKGVATTFVTDYHSLGVNSSMLGWGTGYEDKHFTVGMTEFSLGIYSDSLNATKLGDLYKTIRNEAFGKEQEPGSWEQQAAYAREYLQSGISLDASYNWLGFSYQNEKFGGIAINVQEQYSWYSKFNEETSSLVFQGKQASLFDSLTVVYGSDTTTIANRGAALGDTLRHVIAGSLAVPLSIGELTRGTEVRFAWNRYYNFGYGRKLFGDSTFALFAGVGGRFIQSTAMFNLSSDEQGITMYSSASPSYDLDYGQVAESNVSTFTKEGKIPPSVGNGYGIDLSLSARLFGKLRLGVSVNNIGSVTYKRNVYSVKDTVFTELRLDGLESNNITNAMDVFLQDGGILQLEGEEKLVVKNAANMRIGASFDFGEIASVGVDFIAPFNRENPGGIENAVYSVGGEVRPLKWLHLSAGYYGGGIYQNNIPVGVNFVLGQGRYEFGISSRDALSFFMKGSNSVSTAFGIFRMRF